MSEYVHKFLAPKLSPKLRDLLLQHFTEIFSDGFETGDYSAWTGTYEDPDPDTTLGVVTTQKHHGTYSSEAVTDGSDHKAYCYKEISDYATIYVRFYIYLDAFSGNYYMYFLLVENTTSGHIVALGVNGGSRYLETYWYDATLGWDRTTSSTTLELDTWTCLELRFTKGTGDGVIQVWKDGTEVIDLKRTDVDRDIYPNRIKCGWAYFCYDTGTNYIDCVVIADTYIGTEGAQTYTKTYNADALLKKSDIAKTYSSDVLLQKQGITKTYTADLLLLKTVPKTYPADVLLKKVGAIKTYSSDALLKKTDITKTYSADLLLKKTDLTKTYPVNVSLLKSIPKTYLADVLLKKLDIMKAYTVDVILGEVWTGIIKSDLSLLERGMTLEKKEIGMKLESLERKMKIEVVTG
ncbi:MAG: hypothetical protein ACE5OW_03675 [Candidatus Bathyarchaeia archaeon]